MLCTQNFLTQTLLIYDDILLCLCFKIQWDSFHRLYHKCYWLNSKEKSNPTVLDLTPAGGSARLVSAVAVSPPFCHVFVSQGKAIGSALVSGFYSFQIRTDQSLRMKDSELVGLKSPSVISSHLRSYIAYGSSFHSGQQSLPCASWYGGIWLFRALNLVAQGCVPQLPGFTTAPRPVSTGSTGKTPFASSGSRVEPLDTACEAECLVWCP